MHLVHLFQIVWFTLNTLYRSTFVSCTNHTMYVPCFHFPPVLQTVCFTRLIELAVKQVQFEHVNTGSFFSWLQRWIRWRGGKKIYENKTFQNSGHAKQNLQGTYKIMNAPAKVLPTVRSLSALFWCLVDEIVLQGLFF